MTTAKKRKLPSDSHEVEVGIKRLKSSGQMNVPKKRKLSNGFHGVENPKRFKNSGQESSQVVKYDTTGDGNCFFHAVFGDNSFGPYEAERAQDMRMEWHKFLSQFESSDDASMPKVLKERLLLVFHNVFPTEESHFCTSDLYKKYLNKMSKQCYFVYVEEVPILASLANVKVDIHSPDLAHVQKIQPDPHMVISYERNQKLWGSKKRETIYLEKNHYSRAKTKEIQKKEDLELAKQLQIDEILEYCNLSKDISERAEVEKRFDELLEKNANGKISDVVEQCVSDIKQRIQRSEEQSPSSLLRCGEKGRWIEKPFDQQQLVK